MGLMTIDEGGAARDARHERDRGCHVPADEARRRAQVRHELGRPADAAYWEAYAAEVDSWGREQRTACDHVGTERVQRTAHGYLGDAPAGTMETLCADCGAKVPDDVDPDEGA